MKRMNIFFFILLMFIIFVLILIKAAIIPITHDEVATPVHYINFTTWQIMMYPDEWPNNHILNTLIVKFLVLIFGNNQFIIRVPNILSFILFAFSVFRISIVVLRKKSLFFIPAALLFVCYPYFLDFFSLCRGYGLSFAFTTASLSYLISGFILLKNKHIWLAMIFSILASYANFTVLVYWTSVTIISCIYFYIKYKSNVSKIVTEIAIITACTLLYLGLIINPIYKMQSTRQFDQWSRSGIFSGTFLTYLILIVFVSFFIIFINRIKKNKSINILRKKSFIATTTLLLTCFTAIMQSLLLKTPSLGGRTALFLYPLCITAFISFMPSVLKLLNRPVHKRIFLFIISVSAIVQFCINFHLKYTKQWWFDENTFEVINYLQENKTEKEITLSMDWHFFPSFYYYSYIGKIPGLSIKKIDGKPDFTNRTNFYYIFANDYNEYKKECTLFLKIRNDRWLLKRKDTY